MDYSLVGGERPVVGRHLTVGTLLTWLAVGLLIIAAATNHIYKQHGDPDTPLVKDLSTQIGAFKACYIFRDTSGCNEIDRSCKVTFLDSFPELSKMKLFENCDKFNAARGFLVLSIIILGIAGLFQLLAAIGAIVNVSAVVGFILGMVGSVCGIVSMALFASIRNDDDGIAAKDAELDYSFALIIIGWVAAFISSLCFIVKS